MFELLLMIGRDTLICKTYVLKFIISPTPLKKYCLCNIAPSLFLFFYFFFFLLSLYYHFFFSQTSSVFLLPISLSYFPVISLHHFILYATILQDFQRFSNSFFITMVEFSLLFLYQSETIYRPRKTKICQ